MNELTRRSPDHAVYKYLEEDTAMWAKGPTLRRNLIFMTCLAARIKFLITTERRFTARRIAYPEFASVWATYYGERHFRYDMFKHVIAEAKNMVSDNRTSPTSLCRMTDYLCVLGA